jgi:hypothetical protein
LRPTGPESGCEAGCSWAEDDDLQDEQVIEMLADVALFEPNQRDQRAYDRFLAKEAGRLGAVDQALAERMAAAWFSLFRVAGGHESAGVEDMLAGDLRLWLMDEAFEISATEGLIVGLHLSDARPFHAGFGIVVQADEEAVEFCLAAKVRGGPLSFRHSLAAILYGDECRSEAPPGSADLALLRSLFEILASEPGVPARSKWGIARQKRPHPPKLLPQRKG